MEKTSAEYRNERFYTQEGINVLSIRLSNLIELYEKNQFPFNAIVFGFGKLSIATREECLSRVKELCDLLGQKRLLTEKIIKFKEDRK